MSDTEHEPIEGTVISRAPLTIREDDGTVYIARDGTLVFIYERMGDRIRVCECGMVKKEVQ